MQFWLICIVILVGYFLLRFGMISKGMRREYIQFLGGILLTVIFIVAFFVLGWKKWLFSILIFWVIITPLVELLISRIDKKIKEPYKNVHEYLAKKHSATDE